MKINMLIMSLVALFAFSAQAGQPNTSGRCVAGQSCEHGTATTTSFTIQTDGGTVTVDGSVKADAGAFTAISTAATLTANTNHLASAAATHTLPACETANIGEWVTVVVRDVSEKVVIAPASGDTLHPAGAIIETSHVIDSAAAATSDGDFITFVCATANNWYSTALGGAWVDGGAS